MSAVTPAVRRTGIAETLTTALTELLGGEPPVRIQAWDGSLAGPADAPVLRLNRPEALRRMLWHPGELGAAQAYVTGAIDVEGDLDTALTHVRTVTAQRGLRLRPGPRVLARLARLLRESGSLGTPLPPPAPQARVHGRLHSLTRDRDAIGHHYDLSNSFYSLILDSRLAYSCAYWTSHDPGYGIEQAQRDKLDLVCNKLGLEPGMRLLDVGCGWGALSLHAAEHFGARVLGVTISDEQRAHAQKQVADRGLADRVEIRLQDYREVSEAGFDAVGSLEMGEHVGRHNYSTYAAVLDRAVRPGGRVLVQQMSRRGAHPGGGPFIESFIAPDMHMRPLGETVDLLEQAGLEVRDVQAMREHYVRTVAAWLAAFEANHDRVVDLVGPEVARVWRLYLVGGSAAFRDGRMGVDQILCRRPAA
ncbi:MAG: class I SAM-dependent methyltransferase [Marmoricola sp.]